MTDLITTNNDLVKRNFELTLAEASDDDLTNAHENVAMVLSMVKAEQLRRVHVLWEAHNAEMNEKHAANLERYRWFKDTFSNPDEGQTLERQHREEWSRLVVALRAEHLDPYKVYDLKSDDLRQKPKHTLLTYDGFWKDPSTVHSAFRPHQPQRCSKIEDARCSTEDCGGSYAPKDWVRHTYHQPSEQEMPGAPVYPAFDVYHCFCCGDQFSVRGGREHMVGGVDSMGQPLYANMTTDEVVAQYARTHPEEFSPDELERWLPQEEW